ncbi:glycosyltransferase family 2 protein [bacterium]|nr:glycosyltransferase family 2 protein [bacterium]MBU1990373.1 glycosyltransferase family 2 protein [bacterium]
MALPKKRFGRRDALLSLIEPSFVYITTGSILLYVMWPYVYYAKNETILVLGLFAAWRYGWLVLNFTRAFIYAKFAYPSLLNQIKKLDESAKYPSHIYFSIPSYKEEPWVSIETFKSIMNELSVIPSSATIIVSTSGNPDEDSIIYQTCKAHYAFNKVELVFQHQKEGKRIAMGHAMRAIARRYLKKDTDYNSVTFFMDGDSYLERGFFQKLLPHFAIDKELGAVTTNEAAFIHTNSNWYKDWFNLKFGQRHTLFQSHSLSKKVLTLTGRLSAYRTDLIIRDEFIKRVENDIISTVMHGKFRFLMGDDKTTWFNLLKDGWNMRYLPDVLCYSLESRDADFLELSRSLPYRWYGNTLRNSNRALALGPKKIKSFFIWWAILDQRISMWTSLVGITGAAILGLFKAYFYFIFYIVWVFYVRTFQLAVISYNGHPVSIRTIPLMLYGQWIGSFVKIKALFNLSDQKWSKGNEVQKNDDSIAKIPHPLFDFMPDFLMSMAYVLFFYIMLLSHDALAFPDIDILKTEKKVKEIDRRVFAADAGVIANDGKDDSLALNTLINDIKDNSIIILPEGTIDLFNPVYIKRSNITIKGLSQKGTVIVSHLKSEDIAAIYIKGEKLKKIGRIKRGLKYGDSVLDTDLKHSINLKWIQIREPNDVDFFDEIHSVVWRKKYPYLRQEIIEVASMHNNLVFLNNALTTNFAPYKSELYTLKMVENITLQDFTIYQNIEGHHIQESVGIYENLFPSSMVDMIRLEYAANSHVKSLNILNAGRHPLVFENVYGCVGEDLYINGAWNKGKNGNGYVKFSRAFSSTLKDSTVKNIRHVTVQWSSANNILQNLDMHVDINLHGGYSHDNNINDIRFDIPSFHHWKGITLTPTDAKWAPPDGKRNFVQNVVQK